MEIARDHNQENHSGNPTGRLNLKSTARLVFLVFFLFLSLFSAADAASFTVNIYPQQAIDNGAQWRMWRYSFYDREWTGPTGWYNSGDTYNTSDYRYYAVEFKQIDGCTRPDFIYGTGRDLGSQQTVTYTCQVTEYIITASSGANGSISPNGIVRINEGGSQTFSFAADGGYEVSDVVVDGTSKGALSSFTFNDVSQDHTISVSFAPLPQYTITASAGSGGTISPDGAQIVVHGSSITFTMASDTDYQVEDVIVDGISQGAVTIVAFDNVVTNHTISVTFETKTLTISAGAGAGGIIAPSGNIEVEYLASTGFTVTPDPGYEVDDVVVDGASLGPITDYTFNNVTENHTISATFKLENMTHTIIASSGSGGTISPTGNVEVNDGEDRIFTMSPDAGYQVNDVLIDGHSIGAVNAYTFTAVDQNHTINVTFGTVLSPITTTTCIDISDSPLSSQLQPAPANVMFILDDSGSMDWEMMTNEDDGIFNTGGYDFAYVFAMGDNQESSTGTDELSGDYKRYWKSQFYDYNKMYYNPATTYTPWATKTNASTTAARSNPQSSSYTLNLTGQYTSDGSLSIKNAHYYVWHDADGDGNWIDESDPGNDADPNEIYLVNLEGGNIKYYRWNGEGPKVSASEVVLVGTPPDAIVPKKTDGTSRTYTEELQNFANWFSYYRRREYAAKAAVANVVNSMNGVQIGFFSIHERLIQSVQKVKVQEGETLVDQTFSLLTSLYDNYNSSGGTPLRLALKNVGRYYDKDDGKTGGIGNSPYESEANGGGCQQSFAILMTDGFYNGSSPDVGHQDRYEGTPYADSYENTLADVAMKYYKEDLANTISNEVPTSFIDGATWQHMITYTVSFGVHGTLNPDNYDFYNMDPARRTPITWPNPQSGDQQKIDDMWHASVNGRGDFLNASDPQELVNSLVSVMQSISARTVSDASVSVNGEELQAGTIIFQSSYSSDGWLGDVKAYHIDQDTGEVLRDSPKWSASEKLDEKEWSFRNIATFNPSTMKGIPFNHDNLSTSQQAILTSDEVDYLKGNSDKEKQNNGNFRNRYSKLGDIVHSAPLYEDDVLYVGANDGMLHAFDAATGNELFAYVPDLVFNNLKRLTEPSYSHKFFVDLTPYAATIGSNTYLVGGLGKGGQGYFMLDITTPAGNTKETAENWVKWEYPIATTSIDEKNNLGYSFSKAFLVQSNDSSIGDNGWVVIFGNGYNSPNGKAVLFVLNAATGRLVKLIETGVNSCNGLSTPVPIDVDGDLKMDYAYAGDLNGNLWKFDFTSGNNAEWEIAYKDNSTPKPLFQAKDASGHGQPITSKPDVMRHCQRDGYMVVFGTGRYLGNADFDTEASQTLYGIWDYGDDTDDSEYLGSFERPNLSNQPNSVRLQVQTQIDWQRVNGLELRTLSVNEPNWETLDDETEGQSPDPGVEDDENISHAGWYFDLPKEQGAAGHERIISDVILRSGNLIATTFNPNKETPCSAGGSSIVHEIDACTGSRLSSAQIDVNGDGKITDDDLINIGTNEDPIMVAPSGLEIQGRLFKPVILTIDRSGRPGVEAKYFSSTSGSIPIVKEKAELQGLYYWREN